uniref:Uncharacterized protein n=1 Tax=Myripristis murdjan TaxID=586833 RepID=A0A667YXC4_9TELE
MVTLVSRVIGHSPVPDNLLTLARFTIPPLYLQQIHNNETGDFHAAVRTDLILAGCLSCLWGQRGAVWNNNLKKT